MLELTKGSHLADRYTLERPLGEGGEAQTWLARDRLTGSSVALKVAPAGGRSAERLRAEWQTQIRLMHAHIVRVFEFHSDDSVALYSQQFIAGPDLGVLAGGPVDEVMAPIGLIVTALSYIHGKGVVHRDLKAANVLLDENGAPYLSDFGVALPVGERPAGGSPIAQSPQSLAGDAVSPADDVFALGGLVYELVSGRPPYSSTSLADDIRNKVPDPLRAADGSEVPAALQRLVARMLDKDAAQRPTAEAVAGELREMGFMPGPARSVKSGRRALADEQVETVRTVHPVRAAPARPESDVSAAAATGVSPRTLAIALTVAMLALLGVVFLLPGTVSDERPAGTAAEERGVTPRGADGEDPAAADVAEGDESLLGERRATRDFVPPSTGIDGEEILFSENEADYSGMNDAAKARYNAEMILGELLSSFETLKQRGVERWAGVQFRSAQEHYSAGDQAYLERRYIAAEEHYLDALSVVEPLFEQIEPEFRKALTAAQAAFDAGNRAEALRLFELAVAITPNDPVAVAGYERARNLEAVLRLVEQGLDFEEELDLDAAESSFRQAATLDPLWEPAQQGLARVQATRTQLQFDLRMSEGLEALAAGDFLSARAAFRMAQQLRPGSTEPADGLLQVDQGLRLQNISVLEREALALEADEHWDAAVTTYDEILKIDADLAFAIEGRARAREMSALHEQLDEYITDPDKLSIPKVMQKATLLVVDITRMPEIGPRLARQRDDLSRLLKRAVTPVPVEIVSDNATTVSVYKVGTLGQFTNTELTLRPGTYVAVGVRPGYRDVRLEFRVAPELDMEPVVVRCEEPI